MMRSLAVLLGVALLGAASPSPSALPPAGDRVAELVGSWTCRNPAGALSTIVYRADGGAIFATETYRGGPSARRERFSPDPAGGWRVEDTTAGGRYTGHAPAWTTDPWVADMTGGRAKMRFERIDDVTIRRTLVTSTGVVYSGVVCAKGDSPPDPSLCAVRDVPPTVLRAVEPNTPIAAMQSRIGGTVQVFVSLDAGGNVVNAVIQRSASPLLNDSSLAAARQSTYSPGLHDCKPVAADYIFTVDYTSNN